MTTVPVYTPSFGPEETENVANCVREGWVSSSGSFLTRFERDWSAYCGRRHGVAVSSGTAALQIAVAALDLPPGSEVILPAFTIICCATAVLYNGLTPVLAEMDQDTWCLDPADAARRITSRTRAIMPVHMFGHPVDMDPLLDLAERHGLAVIEDAAQAHGARHLTGRNGQDPQWRRCGSFGTVSAFSFFANKPVTTGEGGMVLTDDDTLAERLRSLRNLCFGQQRFVHESLGHNFRMTNLQAALGVPQVARMEGILERKRRIAGWYRDRLQGLPLHLAPEKPWAENIYWMAALELEEQAGMDAAGLAETLHSKGIETRPFFWCLHEQPAFQRMGLFRGDRFPHSERAARRGLYLPSGLDLDEGVVDRVCAAVRKALGG